MNASLFHLI